MSRSRPKYARSHVDGFDIVQSCQINLCLSSVSFSYPFPRTHSACTCTHTLYCPLLGTNENGHIVNNIKRSPTLAIFGALYLSLLLRPTHWFQ